MVSAESPENAFVPFRNPLLPTADDLWRFVWDALAEYGACDAWGSKEQRLVTLRWHSAGRPNGIAEFIIAHASAPAEIALAPDPDERGQVSG